MERDGGSATCPELPESAWVVEWRIALSGIRPTEVNVGVAGLSTFRVPGGTYFFTINLLERQSDLLVRHIDALRRTRRERPFHIDAWVVLPEHMHCVITLPEGDDDFSNRIKAGKPA